MKKSILFVLIIPFLVGSMACMNAQQSDAADNSASMDQDPSPKVENLSQSALADKLLEEGVVLVDVRTPEEVNEGFIPGASHFIDFYESDFESEIDQLDKSKTYVMYCRSGGRSGKAANYMIKNGFDKVFNLEGGITQYQGDLEKNE